jgi:hypothetical protein
MGGGGWSQHPVPRFLLFFIPMFDGALRLGSLSLLNFSMAMAKMKLILTHGAQVPQIFLYSFICIFTRRLCAVLLIAIGQQGGGGGVLKKELQLFSV